MGLGLFPWTKPKSRNTQIRFVNARRQHKCGQAHTTKANMDFSISLLLHFLLLVSLVCHVYSSEISAQNQTFQPEEEFHKLKRTIGIHLQKINKPYVKTIQVHANKILKLSLDCIVCVIYLSFFFFFEILLDLRLIIPQGRYINWCSRNR
jgi:quinol-cytochrome oxidoreductase complex cytochrome b subunit